ncbi:MAG: helix-turn-helix domain-containing protein [Ectobacillus sp.]
MLLLSEMKFMLMNKACKFCGHPNLKQMELIHKKIDHPRFVFNFFHVKLC